MAKLYGKGTITELVKGKKYRLELSAGKNPITGKYDKVKETFLGTKRQAELRIEEIRRDLNMGKIPNADRITFSQWCEHYLSNRERAEKCRTSTLKRDRGLAKHLVRGLGNAKIADITPMMVETFYISMKENSIGETTIRQCHRLLKAMLKKAVNDGIILRNPVEAVESPKKPKPQRNALSPEEANRLASICSSGVATSNKTAVFLALATGARLGEILGLTWACVALDGRPYVHLMYQYTHDGRLTPLKTDKDDNPTGRVVPIDRATVEVLARWKSEQRVELNKLGIEQGTNTPIVSNALGGFTDHHNFEHWFQRFCIEGRFGKWVSDDNREMVSLTIGDDSSIYSASEYIIEWRDAQGWPCDEYGKRFSRSHKKQPVKKHYSGLRFHELRHTHFTLRLASGMDIPTAQALGGWSTPFMLLSVYAHPVEDNIWNSAGFMDKLSGRKLVQEGRF